MDDCLLRFSRCGVNFDVLKLQITLILKRIFLCRVGLWYTALQVAFAILVVIRKEFEMAQICPRAISSYTSRVCALLV